MKEREYLKEHGKKITDSSVRKEIVNEYEAHIEDCKVALMESGMTEVEAEEEAVRQMGDPQEAGEAMDKIYHKVFDSNMFLWMLALGCIPIVCVCISYLIARDPNAFLWLWNEALGLNKRRRSVAFERVVFIDAGKDVITIQRLHDRLEQDEFSLRVLAGHRIVERAARCVGHDEARDVHIANDRDDLLRRLLRQRIYTGK